MALTTAVATPIQRQWAVEVNYQLQAGGTAGTGLGNPSTGNGIQLPLNTGHGDMSMKDIPSLQIRQDGLAVRGRHGSQTTKGAYKGELQAYNFDSIFEAVMRGTWAAGGTLGGSILVNPLSGNLVRRYWTIEEYERDLQQSEVYSNCVWSMVSMSMKADGMIACDVDWVGTGQADLIDGTTAPTAPIFTTSALPSTTAGVPVVNMAALDATVSTSDMGVIVNLTDWSLKLDLKVTSPPVAGARFSPDVFDGVLEIGGSMKMMRADLIAFRDALAELPVTMTMTAQTPPVTFGGTSQILKFTIPNMTFGAAVKSDFKRDGGPLEVTVPFPSALIGVDDSGGINPPTMLIIERNY